MKEGDFMSKMYLVGGAVRDELIGVEPHDRDYVVVGSTVKKEKLEKRTVILNLNLILP